MIIVEDHNPASIRIQSYKNGQIKINGEWITHSVLLSSTQCLEWSPALEALEETDLELIFQLAPDLVIFGTGVQHAWPSQAIQQAFLTRHIGFECMNSEAACRTFTLLTAEKRQVVAVIWL